LAIGYWLLAIGYWLLAIGYWILDIGSFQLGAAKSPLARIGTITNRCQHELVPAPPGATAPLSRQSSGRAGWAGGRGGRKRSGLLRVCRKKRSHDSRPRIIRRRGVTLPGAPPAPGLAPPRHSPLAAIKCSCGRRATRGVRTPVVVTRWHIG
jgi:hypothetical protein